MALCDGALAQLGEHLLCKQGVIGSIPIGSTSLRLARSHRFSRDEDIRSVGSPAVWGATPLFDIVNGF